MNTQNDDRDVQAHCFEPFPEPQTIPSGWDLSEIMTTPQPASFEQSDDASESESN